MEKMMGFKSFGTSKNKDHSKSSCEAVFKNSKARREYRQYMNRRGGFDRNLDKIWFLFELKYQINSDKNSV